MRIKDILQLLKALILISEQVTNVISETSIPVSEQPEMKKEVDLALSRLQSAKSKIEIDPN